MKNRKIELRNGKVVTLDDLFKAKNRFHKELAGLPFEEKIEILMKMRKIVEIKRSIDKILKRHSLADKFKKSFKGRSS